MDSVRSPHLNPETASDDTYRKRLQAITFYSLCRNHYPSCECCYFPKWCALTIDHVNDNKVYCVGCIIRKSQGLPCTDHACMRKYANLQASNFPL